MKFVTGMNWKAVGINISAVIGLLLVGLALSAYDIPQNPDRERVGLEYSYSEGRGTQTQFYRGTLFSSVSVYESRSSAGVVFQGNVTESISLAGRAGFYRSTRYSPEGAFISSLDENISGPYYGIQIWYNFKKGE